MCPPMSMLAAVIIWARCTQQTMSFEIYSIKLADRLKEISEDGLGQKEMQHEVDTKATFRITPPNGEQTVHMLATSLGTRLNVYNKAVIDLQQKLSDHYSELLTPTGSTAPAEACCKVDDTHFPYSEQFNSKVDVLQACMLYSSNATMEPVTIPKQVTDTLHTNNNGNANIAWQYFGNDKGESIIYPKAKILETCGTFDPRIRPWYIMTNSPAPKDIIIAFENTENMMVDEIKKAVILLLKTTNPNDRITVLSVDSEARTNVGSGDDSTCYSLNLALATPQNRNAFIKFIGEMKPSKVTAINYIPMINVAFRFFKRSAGGSNRNKLLVFLSASNPADVKSSTTIIERVREKNNMGVVIQTYAFGTTMTNNTREILTAMAEATPTLQASPNIKQGSYTRIEANRDLRFQLQAYYNVFANSSAITRPLVTMPYVDALGLGLIVSVCLPVHTVDILRGVVCIDAKFEDILYNVTYYPQNTDTYVFIIDMDGRTLLHPSLPKPTAHHHDPVFIDITTLERNKAAAEVLASMKRGGNGSKTFFTSRGKHGPDDRAASLSHYYWTKVPHTDYSLCVVFTDCDGRVEISRLQNDLNVKYLHPHSFLKRGTKKLQLCKHMNTSATKDGSIVTFSGSAYHWLTKPIDYNNSIQSTSYTNFFEEGAFDQEPALKRATQAWVTLSGLINDIWQSETSSRYDSVIVWRHLVTTSGVIRVYPGTFISPYDASIKLWYKLAILHPGLLIMTSTSKASLMLSQAIYTGSVNSQHSSRDLPIAVVAGEIKANFISNLIQELYPACLKARCFLIDWRGNVLATSGYPNNNNNNNAHLFAMENAIANYLATNDHMVETICWDFENYRIKKSWMVTLSNLVVQSELLTFELHTVEGTNMLLGITWPDSNPISSSCKCQHKKKCEQNIANRCKCPCYDTLRFNFCNNSLDMSKPSSVPTCSILRDERNILLTSPNMIEHLNPCFVVLCKEVVSSSVCLAAESCKWCLTEGESIASCHEDNKEVNCIIPAIPATPVNVTVLVLAILFVILLIVVILIVIYHLLRYCSCIPNFCPGGEPAAATNHQAETSQNMLKRGRAPAPPPPPKPKNNYTDAVSSVKRSFEKNNEAYLLDDKIYDEVQGSSPSQFIQGRVGRIQSQKHSCAPVQEDVKYPPLPAYSSASETSGGSGGRATPGYMPNIPPYFGPPHLGSTGSDQSSAASHHSNGPQFDGGSEYSGNSARSQFINIPSSSPPTILKPQLRNYQEMSKIPSIPTFPEGHPFHPIQPGSGQARPNVIPTNEAVDNYTEDNNPRLPTLQKEEHPLNLTIEQNNGINNTKAEVLNLSSEPKPVEMSIAPIDYSKTAETPETAETPHYINKEALARSLSEAQLAESDMNIAQNNYYDHGRVPEQQPGMYGYIESIPRPPAM